MAGCSVTELYSTHTQYPINNRLPDKRSRTHYPLPGLNLKWSETQAFRLQAPESLHFCELCREEQIRAYGFPFWHRAHQLPGMYWCPWHKRLLLRQDNTATQNHLPSTETAVPALPPERAMSIQSRPALGYFIDAVVDGYSSSHRKAQLERLDALRRRATELDVDAHPRPNQRSSSKARLGELALGMLPTWWLEDVYECTHKTLGKYISRLDHFITQDGTGRIHLNCAMAEALLTNQDEMLSWIKQ